MTGDEDAADADLDQLRQMMPEKSEGNGSCRWPWDHLVGGSDERTFKARTHTALDHKARDAAMGEAREFGAPADYPRTSPAPDSEGREIDLGRLVQKELSHDESGSG